MTTATPRVKGEWGPDHDLMMAWSETHMSKLRSDFIKWLLGCRLRVSCPGDPVENTVGKYTPMKLYVRHLHAAGINVSDSAEDIDARKYTRRVLSHLLNGIRFTRKQV